MSGGVDSSASAMLLKSQGYKVIGIHFIFYAESGSYQLVKEELDDLAQSIGIHIHLVDVRNTFSDTIIKPFIQQYLSGTTPFPCALCNKTLKWPLLFEHAENLGCTYVATGHYARIIEQNGSSYIQPATDKDKDQSFFLWSIKKEWMSRILFPLGELNKPDVRKFLSQSGQMKLSIKKDSLGVCFAETNYKQFLDSHVNAEDLKLLRGNFVDINGNILGKHEGIHRYTVGQRRGFKLNIEGPLFVTHIDPETNNITIAAHEHLFKASFYISDYYFINPESIWDSVFDVKIRYRKQLAQGRLEATAQANRLRVVLEEPEYAIAKGQTAVFMKDGAIVGGGFIA